MIQVVDDLVDRVKRIGLEIEGRPELEMEMSNMKGVLEAVSGELEV